jgi:hypothetical protein
MVKIKFIVGGANSAIGGFTAGDMLVCSEGLGKHFVDDIKCAKYIDFAKQGTVEDSKPLKRMRRERKD